MTFNIRQIGKSCAGEITGLDCSRPIEDETLRAVRRAYVEYPVLVFRDQEITAPQLAAFGRLWGKLESYGGTPSKPVALKQSDKRETPDQMLYVSQEDSDVLIMTNEILSGLPFIGIVDNAEAWHSDAPHTAEPCKGIILYAVRNPSSGGGETEFSDLRAVYDALPQERKAELSGRAAIHHWSKSRNPRLKGTLDAAEFEKGEQVARMVPEMRHPVIRTHPESGRPGVYVSPRFTIRLDGFTPERSDAILDELFALAEDPRFIYRHEWREKDILMWDNRCLNHRVRSYSTREIRCRHRVTVAGDRPFYLPAG